MYNVRVKTSFVSKERGMKSLLSLRLRISIVMNGMFGIHLTVVFLNIFELIYVTSVIVSSRDRRIHVYYSPYIRHNTSSFRIIKHNTVFCIILFIVIHTLSFNTYRY